MVKHSLTKSKGGRAVANVLKYGVLGLVAWQGKGCWDSHHQDPNNAQPGRISSGSDSSPPAPPREYKLPLPNYKRSATNLAKNARDEYKVPVEFDKKNIMYVGSGLPMTIGNKPVLDSKNEGNLIVIEPGQTQAFAQTVQKHQQRKAKLGTEGQLYIVFLPRVKDDAGNEIKGDMAHIIGYDIPNARKATYAVDPDTGFVYSNAPTEREQSKNLIGKLFANTANAPVNFNALETQVADEALASAKLHGIKVGEKIDGEPEFKYGDIRWTDPKAAKLYGKDAGGDLPTPRRKTIRTVAP